MAKRRERIDNLLNKMVMYFSFLQKYLFWSDALFSYWNNCTAELFSQILLIMFTVVSSMVTRSLWRVARLPFRY